VTDRSASERFYGTVLARLGIERTPLTGAFTGWQELWLEGGPDQLRVTGAKGSLSFVRGAPTENAHLAFATDDDGDIRPFHAAAVAAGSRSNGSPGERPQYHPGYDAAFVLDPDGNNVEVVNHHR